MLTIQPTLPTLSITTLTSFDHLRLLAKDMRQQPQRYVGFHPSNISQHLAHAKATNQVIYIHLPGSRGNETVFIASLGDHLIESTNNQRAIAHGDKILNGDLTQLPHELFIPNSGTVS